MSAMLDARKVQERLLYMWFWGLFLAYKHAQILNLKKHILRNVTEMIKHGFRTFDKRDKDMNCTC